MLEDWKDWPSLRRGWVTTEQDRPGTGWQGPPLQETKRPPVVDK